MCNGSQSTQPQPGLLVEDTTMAGGTDVTTGAPVVRPKGQDGKADASVKPTDIRESHDNPHFKGGVD